MKSFLLSCLLLASLGDWGQSLFAATSTTWETAGFSDLLKGRIQGLSLSSDGILLPGPAQKWGTAIGQPALWAIAPAPDGTIYAATGHAGKVFRVTQNGGLSPLWTAEQPEVFALAVDHQGRVYAGTSPNGAIYRIENGRTVPIWRSPSKYIWSLAVGDDNSLYVGTGESGRIYKLSFDGKSELFYDTEQANVTTLSVARNGTLYAGTEPNGIVYQVTGANHAKVVYDSTLPEIRAIVPAADGSLYIAAMGGAISTRTVTSNPPSASTSSVVTASNPTVITVTEAHGAENIQAGSRASATGTVPTTTAAQSSATAITEVSGAEKSAIYRIAPDGTAETLRSSKDDNIYDLALIGDSLLFSTDDHGRVYRLDGTKTTLLVEAGDGETTRILQNGHTLILGASNPGRLLAFDLAESGKGAYQSAVHDAGSVARWGHLQWRGTHLAGLQFQTRTGNSARPDDTWSAWSAPIADPQHSLIASPLGRYIQWRASWDRDSKAECSSITVPYLPQNGAPVIRSIMVTSVLGTNPSKAAAGTSSATSAYSVTVTDTGDPPPATTSTGASQTATRLQSTQTQITWQADDPDSDKLAYAVYFRPEEGHDWQLIRSRMTENTLLLDPDVFGDGRYLFRVVATDAPANAALYAKQSEYTSAPVLIDNTPPVVTLAAPRRSGSILDVDFSASDTVSALKRCEYSVDGGSWQPIEASDGITDTASEQFHVHLERLRPGEHLFVVRVFDTAGNAGLAHVVVP